MESGGRGIEKGKGREETTSGPTKRVEGKLMKSEKAQITSRIWELNRKSMNFYRLLQASNFVESG